jgi:hypothetical protein
MTRAEEKTKRCRFRLWQLFGLIAFVGVVLWFSQHIAFGIGYGKVGDEYEGYLILKWDSRYLVEWDSMKDEHGTQVFP